MGNDKSTQVAVIGAGPGGYAAAFRAADLGMQVTLIDSEPKPGGVCLYRGCIPSKALLHIAKVLTDAREAADLGIEFAQPTIHLNRVRTWKDNTIQKLTAGLAELCKHRNVSYIQGRASFLDAETLRIQTGVGAESTLAFDHTILATGSRPATVPNQTLQGSRILDSTSALELDEIPKNMLVVGGGYIGLELGSVYAALGTEISVVEMLPGLLTGVDRDLVNVIAKRLKKLFKSIATNTKVAHMEETAEGIRVRLEGEEIEASDQVFEKILISVGRKPNTSGLGLENTQVEVDRAGFVLVDAQRRTKEPTIYAIGDAAGEPMLAHKASHEGLIAAEAIAGRNVAFEPRAIPAVVFTEPEIAWCGLTETQAKSQNRPVEVVRFPWGASGRATTLGRHDGFTKMLIDPETERVLGVGIVGAGAGELIAEGVLAIEMAATASDIQWTIHPHPTLSETVMETAEVFFGHSTHMYRPK